MTIKDRQMVVRARMTDMGKECESLIIRHQKAAVEVAEIASEKSRLQKELEALGAELDELDLLIRLNEVIGAASNGSLN